MAPTTSSTAALGSSVEDLIADEALTALAALYDEKDGSICCVLAALEVAAAAAIDSDATRLEAGHADSGSRTGATVDRTPGVRGCGARG